MDIFSPQNGGLIIWPPSVRPYVRTYVRTSVRGQRFLRSVWVNWLETLGQEQVRSEDYARQIDFWYHSKWRPGGHLGCKQTWSRNSNNYNSISFKLGAERTLGMANMNAHLFSVWFKKWRHRGHICFLTPMITLFWLISRKLCKIGDQLPLLTYRKSHMKFHLARFSLTLSDLERSSRWLIGTERLPVNFHPP